MWWKENKDYRYDKPLKRHTVETGKGIVGCEMNDIHGYGNTMHRSQFRKKRGRFYFDIVLDPWSK